MNSSDLIQRSDGRSGATAAEEGRAPTLDPPSAMPWTRQDLLLFGILALVALAAVWRYWKPGIPNLGDMLMGVFRVYLLEQDWRYGLFYPRIATDLNFGYGAPLFEYYPPLAAMATLVLKLASGVGYVTASKAISTLTMILAAWGSYTFARLLVENRGAAATAATIYLFSPYLLLTLYERGAAAELLALALLPWLLWSYHRLLIHRSAGRLLWAALFTALIALAHNITSLFAIPLVLIWIMLHAWHRRAWSSLGYAVIAAVLGLGASAFYWMPAMGELGYAELQESVLDEYMTVGHHLKQPGELIQRQLFFDYWFEHRFEFGLGTFLLGVIGSVGVVFQRKRMRFSLSLLAIAWIAVQVLQLQFTELLWTGVPLIEFIQFPWRLYGFASLAISILAGALMCLAGTGRERIVVAIALLVLAIVPATRNANPDMSPIWYVVGDADIDIRYLYRSGRQGFALFTDYTPNDLAVSSHELSLPRPDDVPLAPPLDTAPAVTVLKEAPYYLALDVRADGDWPLRLHRIYFPGWQVYVDGAPVATRAESILGLAEAQIPAGHHLVEAKFEQTKLRRIADGIAIGALLALLGLAIWILPLPRGYRIAIAAAVVAVALAAPAGMRMTRDRSAHVPTYFQPQFGQALQLLGYEVPDGPWAAGSSIPIRLHWLARRVPETDYKIFIHLVRLDDSGREAQSDEQPRLGFSPMSRWLPGEVIADTQELFIEPDVPPGRYLLVLGVYDPATVTNLPISAGERVLPGERVIMTEVDVHALDGQTP